MEKVTMSAPWTIYSQQIAALFEKDSAVNVVFDGETKDLKLYVKGQAKAEALEKLLPAEKDFGGVKLKITVIPANEEMTPIELIRNAFSGNPALEEIITGDNPMTSDFNYVIFRREVVQYWADNLGDANGVVTTLYQDLAREVLGDFPGVYYNTSVYDPCEE